MYLDFLMLIDTFQNKKKMLIIMKKVFENNIKKE